MPMRAEELKAALAGIPLEELERKSTPGDWQRNGSHIYGPDPGRRLICQLQYEGDGDGIQDLANQQLILSAPQLLAIARGAKEALAEKDAELERLRKILGDCARVCGQHYQDSMDLPLEFVRLNESLIARERREVEFERQRAEAAEASLASAKQEIERLTESLREITAGEISASEYCCGEFKQAQSLEIASLKRELEEDRGLLDWVIKHSAEVKKCSDGQTWGVFTPCDLESFVNLEGTGESPRAAIIAARSGCGKDGESR